MSRRTPRFIVSAGPVNRRTRPPSATPETGKPVAGRIAAMRGRLELGLPLRQQLARAAPRRRRGSRHAVTVLLVAGLVSGFLASLWSFWWLSAAGVMAIVAGGILHRRDRVESASTAPFVWLDDAVLQAFDRLLVTIAAEVQPSHRERLCEIKTAVVGIARSSNASGEHLAIEDRHYVVECLRRYLPDSLTAYLAVPVAQRCRAGTQRSLSAKVLLDEQLRLLRDELRLREAKAADSATEQLRSQHRFLASKRGSG